MYCHVLSLLRISSYITVSWLLPITVMTDTTMCLVSWLFMSHAHLNSWPLPWAVYGMVMSMLCSKCFQTSYYLFYFSRYWQSYPTQYPFKFLLSTVFPPFDFWLFCPDTVCDDGLVFHPLPSNYKSDVSWRLWCYFLLNMFLAFFDTNKQH